jgi:hypothetical protein
MLTITTSFCHSQKVDSTYFEKKSTNLKLSYNSSLIYPGSRIGVEFPIKTIHITKLKASGVSQDFVKDRFITANISWYHHPKFHDNIYLTSGWTMRRTKSKGFIIEFSPEVGISRTFLGGTTYKVDSNGNVSIEKFAGYYYALLSIGGGIGYDFSRTKHLPLIAFSKLNILTMFPYNSTIYMKPAFEIGLVYKPSNFLSLKVKSKRINR